MTEPNPADPGQALPATEEFRPQVPLPPAGVPTWALAVGAVAIGCTAMLTLNGQSSDQKESIIPRSYAAAAVPALPPILQGGLGAWADRSQPRLVRARVEPSFGQGGPGSDVPAFASPMSGRARPDHRGSASQFNANSNHRSTEGPAYPGGFATQPMPGAPGAQSTGPLRPAGPPGSSLVFDGGPAGALATGDEKLSGEGAPARATLIRNRPMLIAQGEIVSATLETPVNSDRPGLIRAIVARDVRSFDGSRVLIPRGSRLIGEFRAEQQQGRRRILATWGRLIRPDGVAIRLDSPVADSIGGTGIPGRVDNHFLARFANAALQTALQIGVNLANRNGSNVIIGNTGQMSGVLGQTIIPNADAPPTILVHAGATVSVFVARDLDFSGVPQLR